MKTIVLLAGNPYTERTEEIIPPSPPLILGAKDSPAEKGSEAYRRKHPQTTVVLLPPDCGLDVSV
ncbi:hypothetical protein [Methanosarcina sp.]|uniref:hypothetical protein n=1 Tax=Methanosarcina sp. TaxID=2213 RepID=UPI003C75D231